MAEKSSKISINECQRLCIKYIKFGHDETQLRILLSHRSDFDERTINNIVADAIRSYPNYGLIQKIVRSKLVCDVNGEDQKVIILDSEYRKISSIHRQRLGELFDAKYDFKSRIYTAEYEYKPFDAGLLLENEDGTYTYNTYVPPKWLEDWFYSNGEIGPKKIDKIPKMYHEFLMHLVGDNKRSYDYIIKWLANGLRRKNYCILATIGKQGIGKGVLGEIMRLLFGRENYYAGSDRMFKGTFNAQISNKRLVYCDEIFIKEKEDEDKLKLVVNDNIEIEKKGIDAKEIKNYANFYVSSNNMDSINLTADDRRFSIVDLTDLKLIDKMTPEHIKMLLDMENIEKLACYLWHVEVDVQEMSKVFITDRTEQVRAMGLKEWEEWFLSEYCGKHKGETIKIHDAGESVKENFGYSTRVGRGRFMELQNKYPGVFNVVLRIEDDIKKWFLEIL